MNSQYSQAQSKSTSPNKDDFVVGHPKLAKLRDLIVQHFRTKEEQRIQSRAMIFSETRDSVSEINACLRNYRPLIRPMEFVGQAGKVGKRGNYIHMFLRFAKLVVRGVQKCCNIFKLFTNLKIS